jgi:MYXO-CTERM domain-containing protein
MPEQISKYPEVTIKVLKGAGARCGEGLERKILTQCPPERFCSLPTGEICVYGIQDIPKMTQITSQELARVVCPPSESGRLSGPTLETAALLGAFFLAGLALGVFRRRRAT